MATKLPKGFTTYSGSEWDKLVKPGDVVLLRDFNADNKVGAKNPEDYLVGVVDPENKFFLDYTIDDKTVSTNVENYFSTFSFMVVERNDV